MRAGAMRSGIIFGDIERALGVHSSRIARAATGLMQLGLREGDAVLILMRNDIAFLEATAAVSMIGASPVPANWHGLTNEIDVIIRDSRAKYAVIHGEFITSHASCWSDNEIRIICVDDGTTQIDAVSRTTLNWQCLVEQSEPLARAPAKSRGALIYTSGTTSEPKAVDRQPMTPVQAETMLESLRGTYGFRSGMRALVCGPLYHSMTMSYALTAVRTMGEDGALIIAPRFDARDVLELIDRHRITHLLMVPVMFIRLLRLTLDERSRYDVSSIEAVTHSAAPCSVEVKNAMLDWWGQTLREFYGASETGPVTLMPAEDYLQKRGSVGKAQPGCVVKILDEKGFEVEFGQSGEIAARNYSYPDFTYRNRPEERRKLERSGLIATGDIGYVDADGFLFLQDRKKDMVITGGVNVFPAEIEGVMLTLPQIRDVAVFGVPDAEFGESIAAHIELWEGQSLQQDEIVAFMRTRVPSYKIPKVFRFDTKLPRDDNGKIAKRRISDAYWRSFGRNI